MMGESALLFFGKILGALAFAIAYDFAIMTKLWNFNLTKQEYRASLRRGRWMTVTGVFSSIVLVLLIGSGKDPPTRSEMIAFGIFVLAAIIHVGFAMRDIVLDDNESTRK